ncbi:MAG: prepilin-type N-terminal cleavage/methylation domain-containing protein [Porticoccaceae bacterium]
MHEAVTGGSSLLNRFQTGFSFVELLVSLLIISSAILGYTQLILRVKSTQYHASESLQSILQADYDEKKQSIFITLCVKPERFR